VTPGLSFALAPGLALALALGLPLALAPGLPLGPQPYNPFVFGPGPKARVATIGLQEGITTRIPCPWSLLQPKKCLQK
jgi:hypothetical protein